MPPALKVWNLNHWTAREIPDGALLTPASLDPLRSAKAETARQGCPALKIQGSRPVRTSYWM